MGICTADWSSWLPGEPSRRLCHCREGYDSKVAEVVVSASQAYKWRCPVVPGLSYSSPILLGNERAGARLFVDPQVKNIWPFLAVFTQELIPASSHVLLDWLGAVAVSMA